MHFPQDVYLWLVSLQVIPNAGKRVFYSGEQDDKGLITLPSAINASFDNGFLVADIIRKMLANRGKPVPASLATIKNDASRSTRLTNWNFIWYFPLHLGWRSKPST
jgi:hypothetical protein